MPEELKTLLEQDCRQIKLHKKVSECNSIYPTEFNVHRVYTLFTISLLSYFVVMIRNLNSVSNYIR